MKFMSTYVGDLLVRKEAESAGKHPTSFDLRKCRIALVISLQGYKGLLPILLAPNNEIINNLFSLLG
jgi:hypothetical protein